MREFFTELYKYFEGVNSARIFLKSYWGKVTEYFYCYTQPTNFKKYKVLKELDQYFFIRFQCFN